MLYKKWKYVLHFVCKNKKNTSYQERNKGFNSSCNKIVTSTTTKEICQKGTELLPIAESIIKNKKKNVRLFDFLFFFCFFAYIN